MKIPYYMDNKRLTNGSVHRAPVHRLSLRLAGAGNIQLTQEHS